MRIPVALLVVFSTQCQAAETGIASVFWDKEVACIAHKINPYKVWGIAHRTLPCGTIVEITNKINGKKIKAPVVDRGPCTTEYCLTKMPKRIRSRIIDMLPEVAKAIGSSGLTPVAVSPIM